mmetsp:Transcript_9688/g.17380  ORF Transcript_9688/g.17380 Transcript_9688/m.17380 type:complete len:205 (-) Transcript_9688:73-687(-)
MLSGEDEVLVGLLEKVDAMYAEQQRLAKAMRKGFLNITKARRNLGPNSLSALNCREEIEAQIRIDAHEDDAEMLWQRHRDSPGAAAPQNGAMRRRGAGGLSGPAAEDEELEALSTTEQEKRASDKDTLMLFGGLVPPPMRKAKADFAAALDTAIAAANIAHRIALAEREIREKYSHIIPEPLPDAQAHAGGVVEEKAEEVVVPG